MKHVLSVGQCGYDHSSITRFLRGVFDVEIVPSATADEAVSLLRQKPFQLILVNRQFDADGSEGLDFIKQLKSDPELAAVPVMLVTNFQDYAEQAVALGGLPGFGKSELGSGTVVARLRPLLGD